MVKPRSRLPGGRTGRYIALVILALAAGMVLWMGVGDYFDVFEPWDEPEPNRAWQVLSAMIAFVLGLSVRWPQRSPRSRAPYNVAPLFVPLGIGGGLAAGSLIAMLLRSPEATFWILGLVIMFGYAFVFGVVAALGTTFRFLVARILHRP